MDWDLVLKASIAIAPVLILLLVFDRLDIFNLITFRTIGLLLIGGSVIAVMSLFANGGVLDGFPIGFGVYSRYVAPIVEETMKAVPIILLFAMNRLGFKLDSAIAGFAIGAGFSVVENGWFLYALSDANTGAWIVRGFGTAVMHGGATAVFAVISHEFSEHQVEANAAHYRFNPLVFLPGLVVAILIHSAFNHFPNQPLVAMAVTLLAVPMTLFVVFSRSERATHMWLKVDYERHRKTLEDIRAGRFAQTEAGMTIAALAGHFRHAELVDVFAYVQLSTELVLRAEEIMLAKQDGETLPPDPSEQDKFHRLEALETRLGRPVIAAIGPHMGISRNDLWEIGQLRARALGRR